MQRRVVVTGIGVVSAIGIGIDNFWKSLINGISGISEIEGFEISEYRCRKAAEIKNLPQLNRWFDKLTRASQYAIIAIEDAFKFSNLDPSRNEIGLVLGTSLGGMSSGERYYRGDNSIRLILQSPYYGPSYEVAKHFGLSGPNITISIACASGTGAIGLGLEIIRDGRADVLICGGVDVLSPFVFSGFDILRAMTDEPVRPFDRERTGLVLGEGAGILILEEISSAKKRGADILAEVMGYGLSSDAEHMTGPSRDGSGLARAIEMAIEDSGITKKDIGFISAHGTGTLYNDRMETLAIKKVFDDRAYRIPVNSIKAMTGHCLGASGAIEAIMVIKAMKEGIIPPTINYQNPDPECDLDYIPNRPRKTEVNISLSISSAFGGNNAAVILGKFPLTPALSHEGRGDKSGSLSHKEMGEKSGSSLSHQERGLVRGSRRPVITGIGVLSSIGIGKDDFYKGISEGRSGISEISSFDPSTYQSRFAAEIKDFSPEDWFDIDINRQDKNVPPIDRRDFPTPLKEFSDRLRRLDRVSSLAMVGAYLAIKDSGHSSIDGMILGTSYGSLLTNEMFYRDLFIHGPEGMSPFLFPYTIPSAAAGEVSIEFKIRDANATLCSGWNSGLDALGWAALMLKKGHADVMLGGGVDAYGEILHKGLSRLRTLSLDNQMRLYKEAGFIPGEGSAFFTIEDLSDALSRGAYIHAEIIGYGFSYGQDFEKAIIRSIRDALKEGNISTREIEAIFLSANSTFIDKVELKAVNSLFGSGPELINLKPMLGETFGAHGPLSMAAALLAERKFSVVGILSLCYTKKSSFLVIKIPYNKGHL